MTVSTGVWARQRADQPPRSTNSTLPVGRPKKREPRRSNLSTESVAKQRIWSCAPGSFADGSFADGGRCSMLCWAKRSTAASAAESGSR